MVHRGAGATSTFWDQGPLKVTGSEAVRRDFKTVCETLLSSFLFDDFSLRLPDVENELHRSLKEVDTALDALQYTEPKDPLIEIHDLLRQFHIRIHDTVVNGTSSDPTRMIQTANKEYCQFVEDIGRMTPRFRPWARSRSSPPDTFSEYPDQLSLQEVEEEKLKSHIVYLDEIVTRLRE
jgi:chromosome condensin MukBEF ATPase and DNA-binding subunit MukB